MSWVPRRPGVSFIDNFHRQLDDMSDGMGRPTYFESVYAAHYNDGVIPVYTRYLDSRKP